MDEAEAAGRRALKFIASSPLDLDKALIQDVLAWALAFKGQFAEALELTWDVKKDLSLPDIFKVSAALLQAFHDQCTGRQEAAKTGVLAVQDIVTERMAQFQTQAMSPMLLRLHGNEEYRERVEAFFHTLGHADGALPKAPQHPVDANPRDPTPLPMEHLLPGAARPLKLFCFGTFRIYRDGHEIASSAWGSSKAKMLLKYLAFNHRKGEISAMVASDRREPRGRRRSVCCR